MSGTKIIVNNTPYVLVVTLYVKGVTGDLSQSYGTRVVVLAEGESLETDYGDLSHSILSGLEVETTIDGSKVKQSQMIEQSGSDLDRYLNGGSIMEINEIKPLRIEAFS